MLCGPLHLDVRWTYREMRKANLDIETLMRIAEFDGFEIEEVAGMRSVQQVREAYIAGKIQRRVAKIILLKKYGWSFAEA